MPQSGLRSGRGVRAVGVATLNANSVKKQRINAKSELSKCSGLAWQYLGVGKFTLGLEWNCGRKARKGHICEDTFAYGSYSSKDERLKRILGRWILVPFGDTVSQANVLSFARITVVSARYCGS